MSHAGLEVGAQHQVAADRQRAPAAALDLRGGRRELRLGATHQRDRGSLCGQRERAAAPAALAGTGTTDPVLRARARLEHAQLQRVAAVATRMWLARFDPVLAEHDVGAPTETT